MELHNSIHQDMLPPRIGPQKDRAGHLYWLWSPISWGCHGGVGLLHFPADCLWEHRSLPREGTLGKGAESTRCGGQDGMNPRSQSSQDWPQLCPKRLWRPLRARHAQPGHTLSFVRVENRADHSGRSGPRGCSQNTRQVVPHCAQIPKAFPPFTRKVRSYLLLGWALPFWPLPH